jgi:hypothetical protein
MEKPNKAIKAKLPVSDTGMVISGMMEARSVRKKKNITNTYEENNNKKETDKKERDKKETDKKETKNNENK